MEKKKISHLNYKWEILFFYFLSIFISNSKEFLVILLKNFDSNSFLYALFYYLATFLSKKFFFKGQCGH